MPPAIETVDLTRTYKVRRKRRHYQLGHRVKVNTGDSFGGTNG
jgi:hypothetical protein